MTKPALSRQSAWIQTYTGIPFWPLEPRPEEINIEDIAHALSNQCRYSGHCEEFYSVAEHSVRVSLVVPEQDALWGLLHDASEAYLVDLPSPLKHHSDMGHLYSEIEEHLMEVIQKRFGLGEKPNSIKQADNILLFTEMRDLMKSSPVLWTEACEPLEACIYPVSSKQAKQLFLQRFKQLTVPWIVQHNDF